ncbi:uncharacterized protein MONBRDRAFT_36091 [Monosiga brevicollis MX1]|uniref:RRM domain-containing protein n=1 Tax=Monosiga brevicollis TaxID=81824 RepID=A9UT12_MONBE|nr:uncharacterized protein MONBRDRAFT_36091 [Monosiga brevicollis MX1]EDQ91417.1 predicted protein [Monosiga brevicollis MX1]|eukprot:XP_001743839.1 hypothetical protein [Monosiga brevicollis MX1]
MGPPSNDNRLFVGGVPRTMTQEQIHNMLAQQLDGVVNVLAYRSPTHNNRGFAFVDFANRKLAEIAIERMTAHQILLGSHRVDGSWARPEDKRGRGGPPPSHAPGSGYGPPHEPMHGRGAPGPDSMQASTLHIPQLPPGTTERDLDALFSRFGPLASIHLKRHFAFVKYVSQRDAERALAVPDLRLLGQPIQVAWARDQMSGAASTGRPTLPPPSIDFGAPRPSLSREREYEPPVAVAPKSTEGNVIDGIYYSPSGGSYRFAVRP